MVLSVVVVSLCLGVGRAAPILDASHVQEHTLANGLHVIVKEERGWGVVAVGGFIRCGLLHDPPNLPGLSHFIEHMLFRAGEDGGRTSELVSAVEGRGGQLNAETTRDSTLVQIVTSPRVLPEVWPVLARTLLEAQFSEEAIRAEKRVVSQEIAEREGEALPALVDLLWSAAYPNHPYGRSIGGTAETVSNIDLDKLRKHYTRFYVPNNMAIIVVGDVAAADVFSQVQQAFGPYPSRPVDWSPPPPDPPLQGPKTEVHTKDVNMVLLGLGFRGPGIARKRDVCAMDLIYTILSDGRKARLLTEVQDKGLVTGFDLEYITQKDEGLVILTAVIQPDKELEARTAIMKQFERLAEDGVTEEELADSKRVLRNSYAFANEAYSDQIGSLGFYEMIDTYRFAIEYIDAVNEITCDDIKRVAASYLTSEKAITVIFRPPTPRAPGAEV